MFRVLASGIVVVTILALAVLPYRFPGLCESLLDRLRTRLFRCRDHAPFREVGPCGVERLLWLRIWAAFAIPWLAVLTFGSGLLEGDGPGLLVKAALLTMLHTTTSALVLLAIAAVFSFIPRSTSLAGLSDHGFESLWLATPDGPSHRLRDALAARAKSSKAIGILDVTGFELLGKGPGPAGGLIHDMLSTMTGVPVHLLLLEPESRALDPDHKHATVYQMLLAEMDATPGTYQRKLRATQEAVEAINERRPPESKIVLRYYRQKPAFRSIVLEDTIFVAPWIPKETASKVPFLEVRRNAAGTSLQEGFRREFTRLWRAAELAHQSSQLGTKAPSTVVRRRAKPEVVA